MSYGYLEARIRPGAAGVGQWPAFWTFGSDVGWPPEFDIAEFFNGTFIRYNYFENDGTLHGTGDVAFAPDGNFHTWGLLWNPTQVRFYRNGTQVHSFNGTITSIPQHVILNFAVRTGATGGPWTWDVDYVRAWKLNGSPTQPVITSITPSNGIPSAGTIQVSFGAVSGATSYRVSAGPTDSVEDVVDTSNIHRANTGSASPITVSGLQNGARYNVTVAAINATGYSIESLPVPAYT